MRHSQRNQACQSLQCLIPWTVLACAIAVLIASGISAKCFAQSDIQIAEYKVKAAFLYKFASYIEWPPQVFDRTDSPLVIGVAGADTLGDELARLVESRTVGGRPVTIRKLRRGESITGLHILFIGRSDSVQPADVLALTKGRPVLTVTESEDAFALGSVVNFVIMEDKVRFDVALHQAEQNRLKVNARLLAVARKVITSPS